MDENKKFDYAMDVEVEITKVISQMDDNVIKKITFETNKGNITWKPKTRKINFINGMECVENIPMLLGEMPPELIIFNEKITGNKSTLVKVCYGILKAEKDGSEVYYRFLKSVEEFKKWVIIKGNK